MVGGRTRRRPRDGGGVTRPRDPAGGPGGTGPAGSRWGYELTVVLPPGWFPQIPTLTVAPAGMVSPEVAVPW